MIRMRTIAALLLAFLMVSSGESFAQKKDYQVACVGFYNLENLFDTIDDPNKRDEEYLPGGKRKWSKARYEDKLFNMAHIISLMGKNGVQEGVSILGVSEIENRKVLEDLVQQSPIKNRNYQIAHFESPDKRGIDVGLLYNPDHFKLLDQKKYKYQPLKENGDTLYTRDQLLVSGLLFGDKVHVIVNHWPSRYGGEKKSRPNRNGAAAVTRSIADSLLKDDANAKIFIMGDLNDDPINESVKKVIGTKASKKKVQGGLFYNPWENLYKNGIGTLAYRDSWNLFDQILLSNPLVHTKGGFTYLKSEILREKFMFTENGRYKGYPKRTFSFDNYVGGYSDHLPVFVYLVKEK